MVNRRDGVELPLQVAMKNSVARERAADVVPFRTQSLHGRFDDGSVFRAEQTAFAGVRVEAADGNARAVITEFLPQGNQSENGPAHVFARERRSDGTQGEVPRGKSDGEPSTGEGHDRRTTPLVREEFSLTRKGVTNVR
jgi:hypothetical protein